MRTRSAFVLLIVLSALFPVQAGALPATLPEFTFTNPIDAVSVRLESVTGQAVSAWNGSGWTQWQPLTLENEQDPTLTESNLVMLPAGTTLIRFREEIAHKDIHPIRVSDAPTQFTVAAAGDVRAHILARSEWGADESLLIDGGRITTPDSVGDNGDTVKTGSAPSPREKECKDMYAKYPSEFTTGMMVTENAQGQKLLWPQQYSPEVRLLVVHHTAIAVAGDERSGVERMRALYQYHAQNRGWGDIGYHYMIDDKGQIYEGRAGGEYVVGGHVYCNNVGTIGVAMMGNFDLEQPTQEQAKSLQRLLAFLADKYHLNPERNVIFHGKSLPMIVGHRQLISTDCPGTAMWSALDQVRMHVRTGSVDSAVTFPDLAVSPPGTGSGPGEAAIVTGKDGLASLGETTIEARPGGDVIIPVFFRASKKSYARNSRIARITRTRGLEVMQERDGKYVVARDLRLTGPVKQGASVVLRVKVRLPMERGTAALKIGLLQYNFNLSGRTTRTRQLINTGNARMTLPENGSPLQQSRVSLSSSSSSSSAASMTSPMIRIRLTPQLPMTGLACEGSSVRTVTANDRIRVEGFFDETRSYRGKIDCRVIDGELALINELPLDEYLLGLAEEPDSEPFEKQRAFAIAARTYALYYTHPDHRKFPGMPYDGSDSPATFQAYHGADFETQNPAWLRAVRETARQVLTYRGDIIRPPYFSSDDGKTRTPAEAGWNNFPFAEIFTAKDDPWCAGMTLRGHGVGMSGCGAEGQANEGKTAEQILSYYYPGTILERK